MCDYLTGGIHTKAKKKLNNNLITKTFLKFKYFKVKPEPLTSRASKIFIPKIFKPNTFVTKLN